MLIVGLQNDECVSQKCEIDLQQDEFGVQNL